MTKGNESFDMEFMMPPDIMSIDSDISKFFNFYTLILYLFRQNWSSHSNASFYGRPWVLEQRSRI